MKKICFHGAESAGKSTLAAKLSAECGWPWVPEYGRAYCEEHGTDLVMADLLDIAEGQNAAIQAAVAEKPDVLLIDTDPLMTAAWSEMLFGTTSPSLLAYEKADLYLLFAADTPWEADGTRFFGGEAERARFAILSETMLRLAGVRYVTISGDWAERESQARAAISQLLEGGA